MNFGKNPGREFNGWRSCDSTVKLARPTAGSHASLHPSWKLAPSPNHCYPRASSRGTGLQMVSSDRPVSLEDEVSHSMKEMIGGCCVCSDERGWAENPLVYCDGHGCSVAVHQACYGIVQVPTGPWFCRKCESQERAARVLSTQCWSPL